VKPRTLALLAVVLLLGWLFLSVFVCDVPVRRGEAVLLAINDVYRLEGVDRGEAGGLARVRALRRELERRHPDLLTFLAGDFLFPSLLGDTYQGRQMVDILNRLDGRANRFDPRFLVTFGNHEFDEDGAEGEEILKARIGQSEFRWLATDVDFEDGFASAAGNAESGPFDTVIRWSGGLRVGVFSLTTSQKHPEYVERFDDSRSVARAASRLLRERGADVVVALTHLPMKEDRAILEELGPDGPDLILGGHDHARHVEEIGGRWLVKADAEARSATVVHVRRERGGRPEISVGYRLLGASVEGDPRVAARVGGWLDEHQREVCGDDTGCLDRPIGSTAVRLVAEEDEIRRYETNLGNWVADEARRALGGDVAFVNAGALRLNYDLPPGPITEREIRELVAYEDSELVAIEVPGSILREVVERAVEEWEGSGHFLQVSGFAFRHDPDDRDDGIDGDLVRVEAANGAPATTPIRPDERLRAVTLRYVAGGGDGYGMLEGLPELDPPAADAARERRKLRRVLREALRGREISPRLEGRICNTRRPDLECAVPETEPEPRAGEAESEQPAADESPPGSAPPS